MASKTSGSRTPSKSQLSLMQLLLLSYSATAATVVAAGGSAKIVYVETTVGNSLHLPCDVTAPTGDRVAVILWYRDSHPDAMYTYDARNTSIGTGTRKISGQVTNTPINFDPTPPAHLTIPETRLEDSGRYECRVDFVKAPSRTTISQVVVVDEIKSLEIRHLDGQPLRGDVITTIGSTVKLACIATGGQPRPKVWWTVGEDIADASSETFTDYSTENTLVLGPLDRGSNYMALECHASNANSTNSRMRLSVPLVILLNLPPLTVKITGINGPVIAARQYDIGCEVSGSRPQPVILWTLTKGREEPQSLGEQDLSATNETKGYIRFSPDWQDNGAVLGCTAENPLVSAEPLSNSTVLTVHYPPRVHLSLGDQLQENSIKEGMDMYFNCKVSSNPPAYKVSFFHNNKEVKVDLDNGVLVTQDHLVLQKVSRKWSGKYTCSASNVAGDTVSNGLQINIQYSPVCKHDEEVVVKAGLGEEIELPCRVMAYPSNVSFTWTFANSVTQEKVTEEKVSISGLESRLQYRPQKTQDYGTIRCWAANRAGSQLLPCVFFVKAAGVPSSPQNCSVSNQTWESIEITCSRYTADSHGTSGIYDHLPNSRSQHPKNNAKFSITGRDEARFLLTVRERITRNVINNTTGDNPVFTVAGLTPGLDYIISLFRFNNHGRSPEVILETFTLRTAENRMREENSSQDPALLGIISGILAVIIIIITLALIFTLRARQRRQNQPLEHDQQEVTRMTGVVLEGSPSHPNFLERGDIDPLTQVVYLPSNLHMVKNPQIRFQPSTGSFQGSLQLL